MLDNKLFSKFTRKVKLEDNDHPWNPQKVVVAQRMVVGQRLVLNFVVAWTGHCWQVDQRFECTSTIDENIELLFYDANVLNDLKTRFRERYLERKKNSLLKSFAFREIGFSKVVLIIQIWRLVVDIKNSRYFFEDNLLNSLTV
jgi:hypothetical protein